MPEPGASRAGNEDGRPRARISEQDGELSLEIPALGWDTNSGPMLLGGLVLFLVGLLRAKVLPGIPAPFVWPFAFLGALLAWRGLTSYFISTRIRLTPTSGRVERFLGRLCSFSEVDVGTLELESKPDDEGGVDLRLVFIERGGRELRLRLARGYPADEAQRIATALAGWIDRHRSDAQRAPHAAP